MIVSEQLSASEERRLGIPQPLRIRAALHVGAGDLIAWEMIEDGTASVRRVQPLDIEYLRAVEGTLSEWAGKADEEAYRDL